MSDYITAISEPLPPDDKGLSGNSRHAPWKIQDMRLRVLYLAETRVPFGPEGDLLTKARELWSFVENG